MVNLITGLVALAAIVVFLGHYAIVIGSVPLWIIIVLTLLLPAYDFWQSLSSRRSGAADEGGG